MGPSAPLSLSLCTYMHNDAYYALSVTSSAYRRIEFGGGKCRAVCAVVGQDIRQVAIIHEVLHSLLDCLGQLCVILIDGDPLGGGFKRLSELFDLAI